MLLTEFNEKKYWKLTLKEGREEGRIEGHAQGLEEGRIEGRAQGKTEAVLDLLEDLGNVPDELLSGERINNRNQLMYQLISVILPVR